MTTIELIDYYANLLILQYVGQPKAAATIRATARLLVMPQKSQQQITFSPAPTIGVFKLSYDGNKTASINWNDTATTVQTRLRAVTGLSLVEVSGTIAVGLVVDFTGVVGVADLLEVTDSTLMASATVVEALVTETDQTLPIAVQNAFDLTGDNIAQGAQLDFLGKYIGISRNANTFVGPITLSDADYLSLLKMKTVTNSAGSSLYTIQNLLTQFFPGLILVFDFKNMQMSYFLDSAIGSLQLAQVFVTSGLLPKPMGVQLASVIYSPDIRKFFGCTTYETFTAGITLQNSPFNTYQDYETDRPCLIYQDAVVI